MNNVTQAYQHHLALLQQQAAALLDKQQLDCLVIHSGAAGCYFRDDNHYPFQANPYFKHWLPLTQHPHCWLMINGLDKPTLLYHSSEDFWHAQERLPEGDWLDNFHVKLIGNDSQRDALLPIARHRCAFIGENENLARQLGFVRINEKPILDYLDYYRSYKSDYEVDCLREANRRAVRAHLVAKEAFFSGASEFDIHLAYLQSLGCNESALPYGNIIAINEHAAVLHYQNQSKKALAERDLHSFLIDAGASYKGYAADITRTYAYRKGLFAEMVAAMDALQQNLIEGMHIGQRFVDVHSHAHRLIARLLVDFDLISCSVSAAQEQGITRYFFPHGLGHQLGLQVHDAGGFIHDEQGSYQAPPIEHPFLRCTRSIEVGQVLTIEPGLYFIDSLMRELSNTDASNDINWQRIDDLRRFGGIRIEDNVLIGQHALTNLTREQAWS